MFFSNSGDFLKQASSDLSSPDKLAPWRLNGKHLCKHISYFVFNCSSHEVCNPWHHSWTLWLLSSRFIHVHLTQSSSGIHNNTTVMYDSTYLIGWVRRWGDSTLKSNHSRQWAVTVIIEVSCSWGCSSLLLMLLLLSRGGCSRLRYHPFLL